ncbi:MAG: hypothetical protein ACRDTI_25105 [Mycobacterium sp.]
MSNILNTHEGNTVERGGERHRSGAADIRHPWSAITPCGLVAITTLMSLSGEEATTTLLAALRR